MIYVIAIAASFGLAVLAFYLAGFVEKKAGGKEAGYKISYRYIIPVFILFMAANIYFAYLKESFGRAFLLNVLLLTAAVSSYQDLKYKEIEDEIHIFALAAGMVGLIIKGFNPLDSFFGLLAGGGTLLLIAILSRGGMGGADIKLNAVYGAVLGLKLTVLSLLIAFALGALTSLLLIIFKIKGRKDVIPFSPFLSAGTLISFIFGEVILSIYITFLI